MGQPTPIELAMIAATLDVDEEEVDWMKAQPKWRDVPRSEIRYFNEPTQHGNYSLRAVTPQN